MIEIWVIDLEHVDEKLLQLLVALRLVRTHTHTHTHTHTYTHTHTHIHTHTHTHTHMHLRTHTRTHSRAHTVSLSPRPPADNPAAAAHFDKALSLTVSLAHSVHPSFIFLPSPRLFPSLPLSSSCLSKIVTAAAAAHYNLYPPPPAPPLPLQPCLRKLCQVCVCAHARMRAGACRIPWPARRGGGPAAIATRWR